MKTKTLATSKFCGPCSMLKTKLKDLNLEVPVKDFGNPDDKDFFVKHQIRAVPRLVIEDGDQVEIIQGMDDIIKAIQND